MRSIDEVNCELKAVYNLKDKLEKEKHEIEEANYKPTLKEAVEWFRYRTIGSEKGVIRVERREGVYVVEKACYPRQNTVVTLPSTLLDGITAEDFGAPIDGIRMSGGKVFVYFRTPIGMYG